MKYSIVTLGCKVNQFETQAMESMLAQRGYEITENGDADLVIVNTCAVTAESGRKSRQAIRRLKNDNPGAVTAVCGCFSQISPDEIQALGADVVFGSAKRMEFIDAACAAAEGRAGSVEIDEPFKRYGFEALPAGALEGRTRAYMKIEDGCENFCSYCVIPFARGRVRSMPVEEAERQAARLMAEGYREIIVTGIEVASYGKDLKNGHKLADVVCAIAAAAPSVRIRLGSLEPTVITEDFCSRTAAAGNICPHFHLSLQSGCDGVLKAMRRKYDTARFYEAVELLRRYFPECGLTADLICGFPGETEEQHRQTLSFINRCAFSAMHVFPYSPRPGTRAAAMPGQLSNAEKERRAHEAKAAAEEMSRRYLEGCIGRTLEVLFETERDGRWTGHAGNYCEVSAAGEKLHSVVRNVKIDGLSGKKLMGNIV